MTTNSDCFLFCSFPCLMLENVDVPPKQQIVRTGSLPHPPRRSTMRIIPILQQPPQLEADGSSASSNYFAFGSSTVNGVTQLVLLRKKRRYCAPTIAQAEGLHAANSFVSLAMQALRHRVNPRTRAPPYCAELDESVDDEGYCTLPGDDSDARPTKRRRAA